MKLPLIVALFLATALGSAFGEPSLGYPTVTIDDAHSKLKQADGSTGAFYELTPVRGVILDASHYQFNIPAQLKVDAPNSVQVIIGQNGQYSTDWKPTDGKLTLDASNLKPLRESPPFAGFQSGETVVFGIGYSTVEGRTLKFAVIWVGMARVK